MTSLYFDPVTGDAPDFDPAWPPSYTGVAIPSGGELMYGTAYIAQGQGPHPVAVFLHGLPGNERNLDLAQAARRAGWTALSFTYRGAWGSGGTFSRVLWRHILPNSLTSVIAFAALQLGWAILTISTLGFLGYGAPPPTPEWGLLIAEGRNYIARAWWLTTVPGLVVILTVLSANRISQSLGKNKA